MSSNLRLTAVGLMLVFASSAHAASCTGKGTELQVLGSGGPEMQTKRASSGYLIWRDGKARVLVDAGGGVALRFGEAGATVTDLDVLLFTHLHVDHTGDFPALIKSSFFEDRTRPLPVLGPAGNRLFPSTVAFVKALFDPEKGAWRYLGGFLDGSGDYRLQPRDVAPKPGTSAQVYEEGGIRITGATVEHAAVPAVAWRIDIGGASVTFSGDTNGNNGALEKLAAGTTIFVAHNAVPEGATGIERALHMPPSVIGRIAASANAGQLVLSHRMLRTLGKETETQRLIAESYHGPVAFAEDLDCFPLTP